MAFILLERRTIGVCDLCRYRGVNGYKKCPNCQEQFFRVEASTDRPPTVKELREARISLAELRGQVFS